MDAALVGLIGVALGGMITSASSVILQSTQARRDALRDRDARAREERQARRLIRDEVNHAIYAIDECVAAQRWWLIPTDLLSTSRWDAYAPALAVSDMSDAAWEWVFLAYGALREANSRAFRRAQTGTQSIDSADRDFLLGVKQSLQEGLEALKSVG